MIEWKYIKGFEDLYMISSNGLIKSLGNGNSTNSNTKKEKLLKIGIANNGYTKVKLNKDSKRYYYSVHRLVALNFIYTNDITLQVNHKDCNKLNNNVKNLEWCTPKENIKHSIDNNRQVNKKGINNSCSKQINQLSINGDFIKMWGSINEACRSLSFNSFGIIKCCKKEKKYNTAYNFKWEYVK